jgi:hypothetical protein
MQNNGNKLTNQQLKFAETADYPRIKHEVIQFFISQFQGLGVHLQSSIQHPLISTSEYKITKGENLELMPYVVLDYPRISNAEFPILTRTIFWWGNHISFNLLIHKSNINVIVNDNILLPEKTFLLTSSDIWNQQIGGENFEQVNKFSAEKVSAESTHIKLAHAIEINAHDRLLQESIIYNKWLETLCPYG